MKLWKYIFNSANVFLIFLVLLTLLNSFLEKKIHTLEFPIERVEDKVLVTSKKYTDFGQKNYTAKTEKYGYVQFYSGETLQIGRKYLVTGELKRYTYNNNFSIYQQNYLSAGIVGELKKLEIIATNYDNDWEYYLYHGVDIVRNYVSGQYYKFYCAQYSGFANFLGVNCQDVFALSYGLTLGGNDKFTDPTKLHIKDLSLSHLVAVSGFQVILIVGFLEFILVRAFLRPKYRFWIILFSLILFIILVGAQPPILRSSISMLISLGVLYFLGKRVATLRALIYSAAILLWINPLYLFSISFQLSFIATLGVIFAGLTKTELDWKWWSNIGNVLWTSVYTFLFTLPIIFSISGKVNFFGILTNFIIVPLIPFITLLDLIGLLPVIGKVFLWINYLLQGVLIKLIGYLPSTKISHLLTLYSENMYFWEILAYYFILMSIITLKMYFKKPST